MRPETLSDPPSLDLQNGTCDHMRRVGARSSNFIMKVNINPTQLVYTIPYPMSDSSKLSSVLQPSVVRVRGRYRLGKLLGSGTHGKLFCFRLTF
jgi:hypothetical protein